MATVAYLRTSTDRQSEDMQREAITCPGIEPERWFIDYGVSGRKSSWPTIDEMKACVRGGDQVVVCSLSRLGKSTVDSLTHMRDFETQGIAVCSVTEAVDTRTPTGQLAVTVLAAVAEMEVSVTRQRVLSGLEAAKAQGGLGGDPQPPSRPWFA